MKLPLKPKALEGRKHLTGRDGEKLNVGDYVIVGAPGDYYGIGVLKKIDLSTFSGYVDLIPWLSPGFDGRQLYVPETYLSLDVQYEERRRR